MFPLDQLLDVQLLIESKRTYHTVNLFGLIAYTEQNPYVIKVLKDEDFWGSLNSRTKGWILYAVTPYNYLYGGGNANFIHHSLNIRPEEFPVLILLAIGPGGTMLQRNYPISGDSVDCTYKSLERIADIVTGSVKQIHPQYRSATSVHREASKALDAEFATMRWKKASHELAELIKGLK